MRMADMMSWKFGEPLNTFRMMKVNQWAVGTASEKLRGEESTLNDGGTPISVDSSE